MLGRWTDLARASLALPRGAEGDRWRAATPGIIGLQAVTYALGDLAALSAEERAVGIDRAEILIRRHEAELAALWDGSDMHPELAALVADARAALAGARSGVETAP